MSVIALMDAFRCEADDRSGFMLAGAARCDITPPFGSPLLNGFDDVVQDVAHRLWARVLYLENSQPGGEAIIVGVDWTGVLRAGHNAIREAVSARTGVPIDRIVINASHTHSAPYIDLDVERLIAPHGYHLVDENYFERCVVEIAGAAERARQRCVPATVAVGAGELAELAFNRRLQYVKPEHRSKFDQRRKYPLGTLDPMLGVLRFDRADGTPIAICALFASHATVYAPKGSVSGSYPGFAMSLVERRLGGDCVALFLQGCAGNISPGRFWPGRSVEAVEQAGALFAARVLSVLSQKMERLPAQAGLVRTSTVRLPLSPLKDYRDLTELESKFGDALEGYRRGEPPASLAGLPSVMQLGGLQSAVLALGDRLAVARRCDELSRYDLFAWTYGPICLVVLPGEPFVEFAFEIHERSPYRYTLVAAYNDVTPQYIPDPVAFDEGGYETGLWCYSTPETGQVLADAAVKLIARTRSP